MAIALDAMGGDLAPAATVEGALRAHRERGPDVILVGDEARLRAELRRLGAGAEELRIHHASEVVGMDEHPGRALRKKKDSSIRVCFDLCREGSAEAMVSAGNSGAVLVEMGANVEVTPLQLVRFALLGEEEEKGTDLTRSAAAALRKPGSGVHFKVHIDGRDVFAGEVDVVATDGFTGDVLLKTAGGAGWAFGQLLKRQMRGSPVAAAGGLLLGSAIDQVKRRVDYEEVGGAPLLGGTGLGARGSSSERAIRNALNAAEAFAARRIEDELEEAAQRAAGLFEKNAA